MIQVITHYTERYTYLDSVRIALEGGCRWIQRRMKEASPKDILPIAKEAMSLCRKYDATFIIDDFVELAKQIVADGVHVHPDLLRLLMRDKPLDKILLVTDALTPTEQSEGTLYANGEEVMFKEGCFHRVADDVIAGSSLTMIKGIKNLVSFGFSF